MVQLTHLRIATRNSPLALWQSEYVKECLQKQVVGLHCELVPLETDGDRFLADSLASLGGKGNFVKALELALLNDQADIAVHSMKDMPVHLPSSLTIGAYLKRGDPRDAFISLRYKILGELPLNARVGTASLRRKALLKHIRPDLHIELIRGNVQTRLNKLSTENFDAIILAAAGLERLGLSAVIKEYLNPEKFIPAINQGILGVEFRQANIAIANLLAKINDPRTQQIAETERAFNRRLGGSCHVPVAGYARIVDERMHLIGMVADPNGGLFLKSEITDTTERGEALGIELANRLLSQGAEKILQDVLSQ